MEHQLFQNQMNANGLFIDSNSLDRYLREDRIVEWLTGQHFNKELFMMLKLNQNA